MTIKANTPNEYRPGTDQRCQAVLKYVRNWRCTRRESPEGLGLCSQHLRCGARVPAVWKHEINKWGVLDCEPIGPIRIVPASSKEERTP